MLALQPQPTTCNHGHHCCNHCKHQHPDPHSRCLREASQRESTNSAGFGPTTSKVCADRAWPAPSGDGHRQYHCYFCTTPGPPSSTARNLFAAALASSSHVDTTARLPLLDVGMAPLHKRTLLSATSPVWPAAAVCRFWCLCLGTHPKPSAWHQRAQLPTFVGAPFALETGTAGYKVVHAATDLSPPNTQAPPPRRSSGSAIEAIIMISCHHSALQFVHVRATGDASSNHSQFEARHMHQLTLLSP
jgi:hypothetical protein